jgi:hypothetical protein
MRTTEYLKGRFWYDPSGQMIFLIKNGNSQLIADIRGWGAIQHLFKMDENGQKEAGKFQDEIGEWIAEALNEKNLKTNL